MVKRKFSFGHVIAYTFITFIWMQLKASSLIKVTQIMQNKTFEKRKEFEEGELGMVFDKLSSSKGCIIQLVPKAIRKGFVDEASNEMTLKSGCLIIFKLC
jgi:hypothetical protein